MQFIDGGYPRFFDGRTAVVAASGIGLTWEVCHHLLYKLDWPIIAVNDAVYRVPFAHSLYAADGAWWQLHQDRLKTFRGFRWSVLDPLETYRPQKLRLAEQLDINLLLPERQTSFSHDRRVLTLGQNSGFQAINLAIHFGAIRIVLVGFNMTGKHYFGNHPDTLRNVDPERYIEYFNAAAGSEGDVEILNATPNTALKCFRCVDLGDIT